MAVDELTRAFQQDATMFKEALKLALRGNVEGWHAVSNWNIQHGRNAEIDRILADEAAAATR